MTCAQCGGLEWICEFHRGGWEGGDLLPDGTFNDCGGPGEPCPGCNDPENPRMPEGSVLLTDFRGHGLWETN